MTTPMEMMWNDHAIIEQSNVFMPNLPGQLQHMKVVWGPYDIADWHHLYGALYHPNNRHDVQITGDTVEYTFSSRSVRL